MALACPKSSHGPSSRAYFPLLGSQKPKHSGVEGPQHDIMWQCLQWAAGGASCRSCNNSLTSLCAHALRVLQMCMGSQAGALKNELHKTDYRRLNLGVAAAAIALMAVRTLHWDMQSALGHLETVFQGGLTGMGAWSIFSPYIPCRLHTLRYSGQTSFDGFQL